MTYVVPRLHESVISHVGPKQAKTISTDRLMRAVLVPLIIAALLCVGYGFFVVTSDEGTTSGSSPEQGGVSTEVSAPVEQLAGAPYTNGPEVRPVSTGAAAVGAAFDVGNSDDLGSAVKDLSQKVDRVSYALLSSQVLVILVVGLLAVLGRGASRLKHS